MYYVRKRFPQLLLISSFIFIFLLSFQAVIDTDYFWHLRVGEYILKNLEVPKHDLFSFSMPNYAYVYHEWGSELLIALFYRLGGNFGVSFLYAVIFTLSVFVLYKTAETITKRKPFLPLFILFTPVAYIVAGGKLRVFGFLLLTLVHFLFCEFIYKRPRAKSPRPDCRRGRYCSLSLHELARKLFMLLSLASMYSRIYPRTNSPRCSASEYKKSRLIWLVPSIFIFWVNLHGSFVLGLLVFWILSVLIFFARKDLFVLKTLVILGVFSTPATLLNPYFLKAWNQIFLISTNFSNLKYINLDWASLLAREGKGWILAGIAFLLLASLFFIKNKVEVWQKLLLIVFLLLSIKTARFAVALFVFLLIPLNQLVLELKERVKLGKIETYFLGFVALLIFLQLSLGVAVNLISVKFAYSSQENYANFLRTKFPKKYSYMNWPYKAGLIVTNDLSDKKVLNEANWGSLLLMLDPDFKVFYYGAMDNFIKDGKPFAVEYLSLVNAEAGWREKLEKYAIDAVFLPPVFSLVDQLKKDGWSNYYEDKQAVILIKN